MRYQPIDNNLFVANRKKLVNKLKPGSMVIMHSAEILPSSGDGVLPFRQDSSFFYLTGIDQEDSILILAPDHPDEKSRELLFVKKTSEEIAVWEGEKLNQQEAREVSGIKSVHWTSKFEVISKSLLPHIEQVYVDINEDPRAKRIVNNGNERFAKWFQSEYPLFKMERLAPLLNELRSVKSGTEIDLIKKAGEITKYGFRRVLKILKPGVKEFQLEAEFLAEFVNNRSRGFAYNPIIASGKNACVLHYEKNNSICNDGDLVLIDVAAEYANYKSDVTRTFPVKGKFTKRQREVYEAVARVKNEAVALLKTGLILKEFNNEVGKVVESELLQLKLLKKSEVDHQDPEKPLYKKYYMHGTSHHLGLDVHDVNNPYMKIEPGMVFTIEPGIYIREEEMGIRLEDDYLVTSEGLINLTPDIPIEIDEIEDIMN